MKRVIIESPYAGAFAENLHYLKRCLRHSIDLGEAPIASHLLYPCVLREELREERQLGIELGYAWWPAADAIIFYCDKGWSLGMLAAKDRAIAEGRVMQFRCIDNLGVGPGWSIEDSIIAEAGTIASARARPENSNEIFCEESPAEMRRVNNALEESGDS